jgi:hypothetical protein
MRREADGGGVIEYFKNGASMGVAFAVSAEIGPLFPAICGHFGAGASVNFGRVAYKKPL